MKNRIKFTAYLTLFTFCLHVSMHKAVICQRVKPTERATVDSGHH